MESFLSQPAKFQTNSQNRSSSMVFERYRGWALAFVLITVEVAVAAEPRLYPYPAPQHITLEDILPSAIDNLRNPGYVQGIKPGEKILIVTDRSVDPLTKEAFYVAAWRLGASQVDTVNLQGRLDITDPTELVLEIFEKDPWPAWVWDAAAEYDRLIPLSFVNPVNLKEAITLPDTGWTLKWAHDTNTIFHMMFTTHQQRERLAAAKDYPSELVWALIRKGYDTMRKGKQFHLTDPNGTDVTWTLDEHIWKRYNDLWGEIINNHSPRLHLSKSPDMRGTFVSTHLHGGVIPRLELTIDGGRVTEVKGGGKMGDYLRTTYEKYKDVQYPLFPGPGVNWVEYAVWGFYPVPGYHPSPDIPGMAWSGKWWTFNIDLKAGVFHIAVGTSAGGFTAKFTEQHDYPLHHKDFVIYRPTLTVDGEKIIDGGHLMALDDPEIRSLAAKYGDPDALLKQTWDPNSDPRFR